MPRYSEPPTREECLEQITRLSESDALRNSDTLRKVLEFLARQTFDSPETHPKEYEIAIDALGYTADFDTQSNSAVRVQVSRLRSKLLEYYNSAGAQDPIVVDLPKGGYTLSFQWRNSVAEPGSPDEAATKDGLETPTVIGSLRLRLKRYAVPLLLGALALSWFALGLEIYSIHSLQRRIAPWKSQPNLAEFWSNFLDQGEDTDVVLADSSFQFYQAVARRSYPLGAYIDHSFLKDETAPDSSEDIRHILTLLSVKNFGNSDEFQLALRISSLDLLNTHLHIRNARDYSATNLERNSTILVGSPIANPWAALFDPQMNFTSEVQVVNGNIVMTIKNRAPLAGEQPIYYAEQGTEADYCIVAFLPNPQHNHKVLLIEGTRSEANEAAANMLLSDAELARLKARMHVARLPYFEVLLKTTQVRSMPLNYTIEAYRTHGEPDR